MLVVFFVLPLWSYQQQCVKEITKHLNSTHSYIELAELLLQTISNGGFVFTIGNGGSCAHADHLVAELIIRFESERDSIPALNLLSSLATLSAGSNDYSYKDVPIRAFKAFENTSSKHILFCFSTSGTSENVLALAEYAHANGHTVVGVTGSPDSPLAAFSNLLFPSSFSTRTALVQDFHQFFIHSLCISIDQLLT